MSQKICQINISKIKKWSAKDFGLGWNIKLGGTLEGDVTLIYGEDYTDKYVDRKLPDRQYLNVLGEFDVEAYIRSVIRKFKKNKY